MDQTKRVHVNKTHLRWNWILKGLRKPLILYFISIPYVNEVETSMMALKSFPSSYQVSRERNGHSVTELFLPWILIKFSRRNDIGCLSNKVLSPSAYPEWECNQKLSLTEPLYVHKFVKELSYLRRMRRLKTNQKIHDVVWSFQQLKVQLTKFMSFYSTQSNIKFKSPNRDIINNTHSTLSNHLTFIAS